jgi:hypothetical protein
VTWKKGQSGNPSGRPSSSLKAELLRCGTKRDASLRLWKIIEGDDDGRALQALAMYFDRVEGRPVSRGQLDIRAATIALPPTWGTMDAIERLAWADQLRAKSIAGALEAGDFADDDDGEG